MLSVRVVTSTPALAVLVASLAGCPDFPAGLLLPPDAAPVTDAPVPDAPAADLAQPDLDPADLNPADLNPGADGSLDAPAADTAGPDTLAPDTLAPDTLAPDTLAPDTLAPDALAPDAGCPTHDPAWWNVGYAYRRRLTVTESVSGQVAAGYSLAYDFDGQSLVAAGKLLATGDDLRVVYHGGGAQAGTELHRWVRHPDTADARVWFKTPAVLDGSDDGYFVYYGNPAPAPAPSDWADSMGAAATPSKVFLAADGFEEHAPGDKPDGWVGSSNYKVELGASNNRVLGVTGSDGPADYLFAGDLGWTDVVITARLKVLDTAGEHYGLWARANGTSDFRTFFWGLATNGALEVWTVRLASPTATQTSSSSKLDGWSLAPAAGTAWHRVTVRVRGQSAALYFDQQLQGTAALPATGMNKGRIGLCAGYPKTRALWDNVTVRHYVEPEPALAAGPELPRCP